MPGKSSRGVTAAPVTSVSAGDAVTIVDVARAAGVSKATVSYVLRGTKALPAETRERVRAAMKQLGYRPSRIAAGLRGARFFIVGLIATDLTFPYYGQTAVGVEEAIEGAGYSLMVANSHESTERERRHVETLRGYRADGLIVTPVQQEVAHLRALQEERYPFVCLGREAPGLATDYCGTDFYTAMRRLIAYLAGELGHRRIALLSGSQRMSHSLERLAAWRDELESRGLEAPDSLVVAQAETLDGGEAATRTLLDRRVPFTAIACVNDMSALGTLGVLHRAGLRVPEDVSVTGFGGLRFLSPPEKPLTTMVEDFPRLGREAGALLLQRIAGHAAPPQRILVPAQVRIGATTQTHTAAT